MIEIKPCKACGVETQHILKPRPDTPHAGALHCSECNRFWGWKKKEKNEGKRDKNKHTPESLGINFCQLCRRPKDRLGTNETLTAHHVIEINENGPDVPANIWVLCTPCHALVHHQRTYLNNHSRLLWEKFEKVKRRLWAADPEEYDIAMQEISELVGI